MADVSTPLAVKLSVYSGVPVGGCGWMILMRVIHMGNACWVDMYMPSISAYAAKDRTFLVLLHMICMGWLCIVLGCLAGLFLRMYQEAARERDLGKDKVCRV